MKPISTTEQALEYCLKRLAACDVTQAALRLKLRQRSCPEEAAQAALARLRDKGYLDDRRSGERLVRMWRRRNATDRVAHPNPRASRTNGIPRRWWNWWLAWRLRLVE